MIISILFLWISISMIFSFVAVDEEPTLNNQPLWFVLLILPMYLLFHICQAVVVSLIFIFKKCIVFKILYFVPLKRK